MYNAIHAARLLSMSTDEDPKHDCYPEGPEDENWCFCNKAVEKRLRNEQGVTYAFGAFDL